jgi:hypothetical protein
VKWFLLFVLGFVVNPALADLYRWVDPETGSVKFSSYPPPWYGDENQEKRSPKVEHIPPRGPGGSEKPEAAPEPAAKPPARVDAAAPTQPAAAVPAKPAASPAELRQRPEDEERRPGT